MTLLFQGGWCLYALRLRDKWRIRVAMREADKVGAGCDDDSCVKVTRENYRSMSAYCNVGYDECSSFKILSDDCGYANAREVCAQPMPCGNDRCEVLGLVPEGCNKVTVRPAAMFMGHSLLRGARSSF